MHKNTKQETKAEKEKKALLSLVCDVVKHTKQKTVVLRANVDGAKKTGTKKCVSRQESRKTSSFGGLCDSSKDGVPIKANITIVEDGCILCSFLSVL